MMRASLDQGYLKIPIRGGIQEHFQESLKTGGVCHTKDGTKMLHNCRHVYKKLLFGQEQRNETFKSRRGGILFLVLHSC